MTSTLFENIWGQGALSNGLGLVTALLRGQEGLSLWPVYAADATTSGSPGENRK